MADRGMIPPTAHRQLEVGMAKNTGEGWRRGQQKDRYQQHNGLTDRWDKYDSDANLLKSKSSPGPFKGIEKREAKKPPRG